MPLFVDLPSLYSHGKVPSSSNAAQHLVSASEAPIRNRISKSKTSRPTNSNNKEPSSISSATATSKSNTRTRNHSSALLSHQREQQLSQAVSNLIQQTQSFQRDKKQSRQQKNIFAVHSSDTDQSHQTSFVGLTNTNNNNTTNSIARQRSASSPNSSSPNKATTTASTATAKQQNKHNSRVRSHKQQKQQQQMSVADLQSGNAALSLNQANSNNANNNNGNSSSNNLTNVFRDPREAPLRKLSVDLIKTYKHINEVSSSHRPSINDEKKRRKRGGINYALGIYSTNFPYPNRRGGLRKRTVSVL